MKSEKNIWAEALMYHIEKAKEWEELWATEKDEEEAQTYGRLMNKEQGKAESLMELAEEFGWITEEQRAELFSDMIDVLFD